MGSRSRASAPANILRADSPASRRTPETLGLALTNEKYALGKSNLLRRGGEDFDRVLVGGEGRRHSEVKVERLADAAFGLAFDPLGGWSDFVEPCEVKAGADEH